MVASSLPTWENIVVNARPHLRSRHPNNRRIALRAVPAFEEGGAQSRRGSRTPSRSSEDRQISLTQREQVLLQQRQRSIQMRQQHRVKARRQVQLWETGVSAVLVLVWASAAIAGMVKLLPVQHQRRQNLAILAREMEQLETRVARARRKVEWGLDPIRSETAIRKSLEYMPQNQLRIVFSDQDIQ